MTRRRFCGAMGLAALGGAPGGAGAAAGRRIVSMDYALAETMIVLGAPPIAMPDGQDWGKWVVDPPLPASVANLGSEQEINLEFLASLKPDLILTTPYLDALVPTLERIAPCERLAIYDAGGAGPLARAEDVTRRIGALVGRTDGAERYLAEAKAQFALDKARLAAGTPTRLLLVNFIDARHVRVYGAKSLWQDVFDRLDRSNAWTRPTTYWGFATVGIEELAGAAPDTTLISFEPVPADAMATLERSPLWRNLPFARPGRTLTLPPALMFGAVPSARRFSSLLTQRLAAQP